MAKNRSQRPPQQQIQFTPDPKILIQQLQLGAGSVPLIQAIEEKRGSRVLSLVYNEQPPFPSLLAFASIRPLENVLLEMGHVSKLDVFLRSTGGMAEIPWRIVSLLREFTDELGVIVARFALSGATHIAIAADDLVMTPFSVLGSVDPTRNHPLLPKDADGNPIPTSVQDLKHLLQFVKDQLGDSYPSQNLALVVSELFKYVDPLAIGALEQSYNLARLISRKVLKTRRTQLEKEKIDKIVSILSGEYFSHSFLISRADVETDLGLPVTKSDTELSPMIYNLNEYYDSQFARVVPAALNVQDPTVRAGAFIETTSSGWFIAQLATKDNQYITDPWLQFRGGVQP